jgi:uncharacterized repeat protein (TIGR01451 family)
VLAQKDVSLTNVKFTPAAIVAGTNTTLSITFTNATGAAIDNVTFIDTLPVGMTSIALGAEPFGPGCGADGNVSVDTATVYGHVSVSAGGNCTVQALVTVASTGLYANGPSNISGWNGNALSFPAETLAVGDSTAYQGLWWATSGLESGWGMNFAHQGDQIYATWYTYDTAGRAWWLTMLASRTTPTGNAYTGTIYVDRGPSFDSFVGTANSFVVGSGTLTFADAHNATFDYNVNGVTQTKSVTQFDLRSGTAPVCVYSIDTPDFAAATVYQDLWWVPNGAESGWGINFAHQGDTLFATWYTYNADHTPLWLSALVKRQGTSDTYAGPIYQNSGTRFDQFDASQIVANPVGTAAVTFSDGNHATFEYTVMVAPFPGPVTQSKPLTRFVFAGSGGTVCE